MTLPQLVRPLVYHIEKIEFCDYSTLFIMKGAQWAFFPEYLLILPEYVEAYLALKCINQLNIYFTTVLIGSEK